MSYICKRHLGRVVRVFLTTTMASRTNCAPSHLPPFAAFFVVFVFILSESVEASTPMWWSVGTLVAQNDLVIPPAKTSSNHYSPDNVDFHLETLSCSSIPGLTAKQTRFCNKRRDLISEIVRGAKLGISECKNQFLGRRWNCTTIEGELSVFGPVIDIASRENAFVHAILSAGLVYTVTEACAQGSALSCGCDTRQREHPGLPPAPDQSDPSSTWRWGGCSQDVRYGVKFSRSFLNTREDRHSSGRVIMNRHNSEVGRQAILKNMLTACKCYGVSGACTMKTCWKEQPSFKKVGSILKDRYDSASEMTVVRLQGREHLKPRYDKFKQPTRQDMIYYQSSPNYCERSPTLGTFGTHGRSCNVSSDGIDGCELMCCGRGHFVNLVEKVERCRCQFIWCCDVKCSICREKIEIYTCK